MTLNKGNVTFWARPIVQGILITNALFVGIAGVVLQPMARPGVIEALIGIAFAVAFSRPFVRAWINDIENEAARDKALGSHRSKFLSGLGGSAETNGAGLVVAVGEFITLFAAYTVGYYAPFLHSPWARYESIKRDFPVPIQSMAISAFVYMIACAIIVPISMIKWYKTLPNK